MQISKVMSLLSLSLLALAGTSALDAKNSHDSCSPYVIPPGTELNHYDLILVLGQDEPLDAPAAIAPTLIGFTGMLGWDNATIDQYRQAAIDWFLERFGIDFNGGTLTPDGVVIGPNQDMAMVPLLYHGKYRVMSSTKNIIPPYSKDHPSSVAVAQYTAVFFTPPTYGGTFANGTPIVGNVSDHVSFSTYGFFLKCVATEPAEIIYARSFYPGTVTPNLFPTTTPGSGSERLQLFSPVFGPGYSFVNSRDALDPINGVFPTNATNTMLFPGTNLEAYNDWNGFTVAPVNP